MLRFCKRIVFVLLTVLACASGAYAWDAEYDASTGMLPTAVSPAWRLYLNSDPTPTVTGGLLSIRHTVLRGSAEYSRESMAIDAGVPVTMEARMCIAPASSIGNSMMSIQTLGALTGLRIYSDHLEAISMPIGTPTYSGDFTSLRTIRIAYDGGTRVTAWVDNQLALSWNTSRSFGQNGVNFGSVWGSQPYDTYWEYVAYSKQYIPLPEPSSLAGLGASLLGLVGFAIRRMKSN